MSFILRNRIIFGSGTAQKVGEEALEMGFSNILAVIVPVEPDKH